MRPAALVIVALVVIWLGLGAPVPVPTLQPLEPSDQVPTFQQSLDDFEELQRAQRDGRLKPDPERDKLRQRVLRAGERLTRSPCNESLQEEFTLAAVPFLENMIATVDEPPVETLQVGDRVLNGTKYFDREAFNRINEAAFSGHIRREHLPRSLKRMWAGEHNERLSAAHQALNGTGC